jgi:hypothetical protein
MIDLAADKTQSKSVPVGRAPAFEGGIVDHESDVGGAFEEREGSSDCLAPSCLSIRLHVARGEKPEI